MWLLLASQAQLPNRGDEFRLDEPLALTPLVLRHEYAAKLRKRVRPNIVEHCEEALTVVDSERDYARLECERFFEK